MSLFKRFKRRRSKVFNGRTGRTPDALMKEGQVLGVVRPENPAKALELARQAREANDLGAFDRILDVQPYTFVGVATMNPKVILDRPGGEPIPGAKLEPGDSVVPYELLSPQQPVPPDEL